MLEIDCGFPSQPGSLIQFGPTLKVQIGFDRDFRPTSNARPDLPAHEYNALLDTGATESCIDSAVAATLGLPVIDEQSISGVHGEAKVNVHLAQIRVPALEFTQYGAFSGVHLHAGGQPHSALLGRTFLYHMTLIYRGDSGSVALSHQPESAT